MSHEVQDVIVNIINFYSIFKDNDSNQGGTVSLLYYPVHFDGTNTFESNTGPTIRVRTLRIIKMLYV